MRKTPVDPNLILFNDLSAINEKALDKKRAQSLFERQERYSSVTEAEKPNALAYYLNTQMESYLDVALYHNKSSEDDCQKAEAESGIGLLLEKITDPKQRAHFLQKVFTMAGRAFGKSKKKIVPYAAQLLATPGIDPYLNGFESGRAWDTSISFGADVIAHLQQEEKLADINEQAPCALQMVVSAALKDAEVNDALFVHSMKAKETVWELNIPKNAGEQYMGWRQPNNALAETVWQNKSDRISESKTPVAEIMALDAEGLTLDKNIFKTMSGLVRRELWQNDARCDGAFAAMAELQESDRQPFSSRLEDDALVAFSGFPTIVANARRNDDEALLQNFFTKMTATLPKLSNPQVMVTHKSIDKDVWKQLMLYKGAEFKQALCGFTYRLGANTQPYALSGDDAQGSINANQHNLFMQQFAGFYSVADPATQEFAMNCAANDINAEGQTPKQAEVCYSLIESGEELVGKQTPVWKMPALWVNNALSGQPHRKAIKNLTGAIPVKTHDGPY